jgi:organic hydroperoxide reductase OsmC/OhrA
VIAIFGYTGPCESSDVMVIALIGVPVGALVAGAAVPESLLVAAVAALSLLLLLLPQAASTSVPASSAKQMRTGDHGLRRRPADLM